MSYIDNAIRFLEVFAGECNSIKNQDAVRKALGRCNLKLHYRAKFNYGCTRYVIIGKDWAAKWDYIDDDSGFGGCEDEVAMYNYAKNDGYEYLLAKPTKVKVSSYTFYIYPRATVLGIHSGHELEEVLNEVEIEYLTNNILDIHDENWGYIDGRPVIIDYAATYGDAVLSEG